MRPPKALLESGDAAKAKALVKNRGTNLSATLLPDTLPPCSEING